MSVTASSQPTGVGEHPLAIWRTRMRTVAAVTLVAAGALQVGGDLLEPDVEGYAEKLTWVAGHPGTYTVSSILWFLSIPLLIGVAAVFIAPGAGPVAQARLDRRRRRRYPPRLLG